MEGFPSVVMEKNETELRGTSKLGKSLSCFETSGLRSNEKKGPFLN